MTVGQVSDSAEEHAAAALSREADALAVQEGSPNGFFAALFGRAVAGDLLRYKPRELAALAKNAWSFLSDRAPGTAKVRLVPPAAAEPDDALANVDVLEIVNDDMPFIFDSVLAELADRGHEVRLVVHPVFSVERDAAGRLTGFDGVSAARGTARRESMIHVHLAHTADAAKRAGLVQGIEAVLADVRVSVTDWQPMMQRLKEIVAGLKVNPTPLPDDEIAEAVAFLEWLLAGNFTFLGVRSYVFTDNEEALEPVYETGLGVLRARDMQVLRRGQHLVVVTPEILEFLKEPKLLIVTKSAVRARVHRRVHMDYIGIKRFHSDGRLAGEFRLVGLFTSSVYTRSIRSIPYLRRKQVAALERAGFDPAGHSGKALANVLETYPRDELFQIDDDTLFRFALAVLQLDERPHLRVLSRRDRFDRFVSVLVFVPRDAYGSEIRKAIGDYLSEVYQGRISAFYPFFPEGPLVRVHFIVGRDHGATPNPDRSTLEDAIARIVRTWTDGLREELATAHAPPKAQALFARYREAFSDGYRDVYSPLAAVDDIRVVEGLSAERPLNADFYAQAGDEGATTRLKVWSYSRPIPLSERVPVLESMGFRVVDELTYRIAVGTADDADVWFHDMTLECTAGSRADVMERQVALEACFFLTMTGGVESDGYNALVLAAGLMWREVALVRTISRFLRQLRVPYSQGYMWTTLVRHAGIAARLVELFQVRFDPRIDDKGDARKTREAQIRATIEDALKAVESLDEDRILRLFMQAIAAAVRTNFYQIDGGGRPPAQIAIKFASRQLDVVPLPRPLFEIFVYSPRVEGVHLRFGKVARGGIRWSDRPQDFRTEVLGLVKAQQVKNAVIVPVGAKGGFVPKLLAGMVAGGANREAIQAEGIASYKLFIATLLDLTDNLNGDGIIPPPNTVRHDDDDPYLVVAADKGTATFSDIANGIADDHGYWLGDAFASGGSAGYDHKKIGITARGAWESVKRHFREMDVDITAKPFTAVGVGDMSGDVFGNGMLRETTTMLVAAFDHRDIFLDPTPDPEKSFAERKRLFDLPRSSWRDYDPALISEGGGVFSRSLKEIPLSPAIQGAIGLMTATATPQELMSAILKAPVDLLFFGGIGTYVRAAAESDDAVGDRANDAVRVTGGDLRCKVVGEGANLGMTQRGRVEAALRGVRLNTDAIDNSAGVNTSDIEVNVKIPLAKPMRDGQISFEARNALLAAMTDEVAALVLRNNYQQPLSLSLVERRGLDDLGFERRLIQTLEAAGELDRTVEFLPDDKEIAERRRRSQALTRPELAVLLAYAKLSLKAHLIDSTVPDDPYLGREIGRYFPSALSERFKDALEQHRLRRDIIVTQLANSMINRGGPALVVRIADQTGASPASIAFAFAAVRDSYGMTALNTAIDGLDSKIPGKLQLELYAAVQDLLIDRLVWFLRNVDLSIGLAAIVEHYRDGIDAVESVLGSVLSEDAASARVARTVALTGAGVPEDLARKIASLPALVAAPDIVQVADRTGQKIAEVAATFFAAESFFRLDRITQAAAEIKVSDYFDRLALDRSLDSIGDAERRIAAAMAGNGVSGPEAVQAWVATRKDDVERTRAAVHEIANSGLTLSKLSVAASLLGDLVRP